MNEKSVKLEMKKITDNNEEKIMKVLHRKNSKHLVEKKRRERINKSLNELKKIIFADCSESLNNNKLEKAHILEMAVKHISKANRNTDNHKTLGDSGHIDGEYRCGYLACVNRVLSFVSSITCQPDLKSRLIENITETIPGRSMFGQGEAKRETTQQHGRLSSNLGVSKSTNTKTLNYGTSECNKITLQHNMKTPEKSETRSDSNHVTPIPDNNELFLSRYKIPGIQTHKTMTLSKSTDQIMFYLIPISPSNKHSSYETGNHDNASNHDNNHDSTTQLSNLALFENEPNVGNSHGYGYNVINQEPVQNKIHKLDINLSNPRVWRPW